MFDDNNDIKDLVARFEQMLQNDDFSYFDVEEFEELIVYYIDTLQFDIAEKAVSIARQQYPFSEEILLREAELLINREDYQKALDLLEYLEKTASSNPELYYLKSSALSKLNRTKDAVKSLEKAAQLNDDNVSDVYFSLALEYQTEEDYEKALDYFKLCLEKAPEEEDVLYELAYAFDQCGKINEGIAYLNKYLNHYPYSAHAWFNLGYLYSLAENFEKSVDAYDYALIIDNKFISAYYSKAQALVELERYQEAIDTYHEILDNLSTDAITYYFIGECYENMGDFGKALRYYNNSISTDPKLADPWVGIACVLDASGKTTEAFFYLNKALELEPQNSDFWQIKADLLRKAGFVEDALKAYLKVVELEPYKKEVVIDISQMFFEHGYVQNAIEAVKTSLIKFPQEPTFYFQLAAIYFSLKNNIEGGKYLEKALEKDKQYLPKFLNNHPEVKNNKFALQIIQKHNPDYEL
ncbi:MAG: tetratricopeptide repeat protein [Bacteroidetes bacterium]|nr:MAG: tetratricopeptide repeat protein [Bacteroidota bacterium]